MSPAERAQLALLLEVAATPTPGNVDRCRDHADLRFEHFLAGAIGAGPGLVAAAEGEPLGPSFERTVRGMAAAQSAGNTQFGALLLLVPLVQAAAADRLTSDGVAQVVAGTMPEDAVAFARAFEHVDVAVGEPPPGLPEVDVRHPTEAARTIEERGLTLLDVMDHAAGIDGVAREWTTGFERSFAAAEGLLAADGPVTDRAASVFLELLAETPDPFVAARRGPAVAERASRRARAALDGEADPTELAESFVEEGINPGTTADVVAAGLFVALERGLVV